MGGIITDAIILHLINTFARVIICGQISQYEGHLDNPQVRFVVCVHVVAGGHKAMIFLIG